MYGEQEVKAGAETENAANSSPKREVPSELSRLHYWSRRLQKMPQEQQEEQAEERYKEQFQRWLNLKQLRWLMYEEQRKFNEKFGPRAVGISIWQILSVAQQELESELKLSELRGDFQRFPTPMSIMDANRWPDGSVNNHSIITGLDSNHSLGVYQSNKFAKAELNRCPSHLIGGAEHFSEHMEENTAFGIMSDQREFDNRSLRSEACTSFNGISKSISHLDLYSRDQTTEEFYLFADTLIDIRLELDDIKRSTMKCDEMVDTMITSYLKPKTSSQKPTQCNFYESDFGNLRSDGVSGVESVPTMSESEAVSEFTLDE